MTTALRLQNKCNSFAPGWQINTLFYLIIPVIPNGGARGALEMTRARGQCSLLQTKTTNLNANINDSVGLWRGSRNPRRGPSSDCHCENRTSSWKLKSVWLCFRCSALWLSPGQCWGWLSLGEPQLGCSRATNSPDTGSPHSLLCVGTSV